MKDTSKILLNHIGMGISLLSLALLAGCGSDGGNDGGTNDNAKKVSGVVAQGKVVGAKVFADNLNQGSQNYVRDENEEIEQTTTSDGKFEINVPNITYSIVSSEGTDSFTDEEAMQMVSSEGAANTEATLNVTPLTTLMALTSDPTAKEEIRKSIESLGMSVDEDISEGITPAAAALVEGIQVAIVSLTKALNASVATPNAQPQSTKNETLRNILAENSGGLPTSIKNQIQRIVLHEIASQIKGSSLTELTDPTTLANKIGQAAYNALVKITTEGINGVIIRIANLDAIRNAIINAVEAVARQIIEMAIRNGIPLTSKMVENALLASVLDAIKAEINSATTSIEENGGITSEITSSSSSSGGSTSGGSTSGGSTSGGSTSGGSTSGGSTSGGSTSGGSTSGGSTSGGSTSGGSTSGGSTSGGSTSGGSTSGGSTSGGSTSGGSTSGGSTSGGSTSGGSTSGGSTSGGSTSGGSTSGGSTSGGSTSGGSTSGGSTSGGSTSGGSTSGGSTSGGSTSGGSTSGGSTSGGSTSGGSTSGGSTSGGSTSGGSTSGGSTSGGSTSGGSTSGGSTSGGSTSGGSTSGGSTSGGGTGGTGGTGATGGTGDGG
ncbi:exported hypothetical protein [Gammaproteobacteria bacterium]